MMKTYTRDELIRELMIRRGCEPLRTDVEIDAGTGSDVRAYLERELDALMIRAYATAPAEYLPKLTVMTESRPSAGLSGASSVIPPAAARRITSVRGTGWSRSVGLTEEDTREAGSICNPYLRRGVLSPMAVKGRDGTITLLPSASEARIEYIPEPEPGADSYTFDPAILNLFNDNTYDNDI